MVDEDHGCGMFGETCFFFYFCVTGPPSNHGHCAVKKKIGILRGISRYEKRAAEHTLY